MPSKQNPSPSQKSIDIIYNLFVCTKCGLEFIDPMPSESTLSEFYKNYNDIRASSDAQEHNALRNINQMSLYGLKYGNKVLDFGSGKDVFVQIARRESLNLNQICNWTSYDKFTHRNQPNLLTIESGYYDAITLWGVIEHVQTPLETLKSLSKLLKPNGLFFITTVDRESIIPYRYKPPEHLTYYTKTSMEAVCSQINHKLLEWKPYEMIQHRDVYMNIIHRTVPDKYKVLIEYNNLPSKVEIPTNEAMIITQGF